jgi:hypothetical protein
VIHKPSTIAAVESLLSLRRNLFQLLVIKNILYEIGDFNLNAAQVVHFHLYSVILIVGVKILNSTNVLTVLKFYHFRFNRFRFFCRQLRFGMPTGKCWALRRHLM